MPDASNIDEKFMKTPYFLIMLLPLFSISWPIMEWSLNLAWLCVPISIWSSFHYGWRGFEMIAIGGLLLPIGLRTDLIIIWSDFGIYLLCLLLSALAAHNRPINDTLKSFRATPGLCIGALLLPIYLNFRSEYGYSVYNLEIDFFPLLFLLMFFLGLARAQIKTLLFFLFLALCFGIAIKNEYLYVDFDYHLNSIAEYIALVFWYFFGSYFRNSADNEKSTGLLFKWPRLTLLLLLFLWGGVVLWEFIIPEWYMDDKDDLYLYCRNFIPSGTWYALPLAALYAGMNFRLKGIIVIIFSTIFYELLYSFRYIFGLIFFASDNEKMFYISAIIIKESPIIGTAFAILGKKIIGHHRIGISDN